MKLPETDPGDTEKKKSERGGVMESMGGIYIAYIYIYNIYTCCWSNEVGFLYLVVVSHFLLCSPLLGEDSQFDYVYNTFEMG